MRATLEAFDNRLHRYIVDIKLYSVEEDPEKSLLSYRWAPLKEGGYINMNQIVSFKLMEVYEA